MFRWFRQAPPTRDTAIAMADPRAGNEVLFLGADDPRLAGATGAITGLNGRTVVVGRNQDESRIGEAAARSGALVEFVTAPLSMLPFDNNTFDLVVAPNLAAWPADAAAPQLAEGVRVLKPGGRIILVAGQKRGGLFGALQTRTPALAVDTVLALLKAAGTIAARRLAEVNGVAYYEGRKPR